MAFVAGQSPNKSAFVRDVLEKNPASNARSVNEAWVAAGNPGRISHALVSKLRSHLGLSGNLEGMPAKSPRSTGRAAGQSAKTPAASASDGLDVKEPSGPGKTAFIKSMLVETPTATVGVVNEAWTAAGHEGSISKTLVSRLRAELGLAGNVRRTPQRADAVTTPRGAEKPAASLRKRGRPSDRDRSLAEIEGDLDRTIFKLMVVGGFERIEEELRRVRRLFIRSHEV